jgi:hypothetical protein
MVVPKKFDKITSSTSFLVGVVPQVFVPQLSKDVATLRVFFEEEAIMRAQQLELIYSQSGLIYEVFPYVP